MSTPIPEPEQASELTGQEELPPVHYLLALVETPRVKQASSLSKRTFSVNNGFLSPCPSSTSPATTLRHQGGQHTSASPFLSRLGYAWPVSPSSPLSQPILRHGADSYSKLITSPAVRKLWENVPTSTPPAIRKLWESIPISSPATVGEPWGSVPTSSPAAVREILGNISVLPEATVEELCENTPKSSTSTIKATGLRATAAPFDYHPRPVNSSIAYPHNATLDYDQLGLAQKSESLHSESYQLAQQEQVRKVGPSGSNVAKSSGRQTPSRSPLRMTYDHTPGYELQSLPYPYYPGNLPYPYYPDNQHQRPIVPPAPHSSPHVQSEKRCSVFFQNVGGNFNEVLRSFKSHKIGKVFEISNGRNKIYVVFFTHESAAKLLTMIDQKEFFIGDNMVPYGSWSRTLYSENNIAQWTSRVVDVKRPLSDGQPKMPTGRFRSGLLAANNLPCTPPESGMIIQRLIYCSVLKHALPAFNHFNAIPGYHATFGPDPCEGPPARQANPSANSSATAVANASANSSVTVMVKASVDSPTPDTGLSTPATQDGLKKSKKKANKKKSKEKKDPDGGPVVDVSKVAVSNPSMPSMKGNDPMDNVSYWKDKELARIQQDDFSVEPPLSGPKLSGTPKQDRPKNVWIERKKAAGKGDQTPASNASAVAAASLPVDPSLHDPELSTPTTQDQSEEKQSEKAAAKKLQVEAPTVEKPAATVANLSIEPSPSPRLSTPIPDVQWAERRFRAGAIVQPEQKDSENAADKLAADLKAAKEKMAANPTDKTIVDFLAANKLVVAHEKAAAKLVAEQKAAADELAANPTELQDQEVTDGERSDKSPAIPMATQVLLPIDDMPAVVQASPPVGKSAVRSTGRSDSKRPQRKPKQVGNRTASVGGEDEAPLKRKRKVARGKLGRLDKLLASTSTAFSLSDAFGDESVHVSRNQKKAAARREVKAREMEEATAAAVEEMASMVDQVVASIEC